MKIGVQVPEVERVIRWAELADMCRAIEDLGLDSIWVGDHLLYERPDGDVGPWESWSTLAAIASITTRVQLGPLVAATSFHNPAIIAKKAATLDEISAGRFILGLGAGWNEYEYRAYGFPYDRRVSRFEEAFTVIRSLLSDGHVDFDGRFYQVRDCTLHPRGPTPGGPPLMVGTTGPRMLQITAPYISAWNVWHARFGNDPAALAPLQDLVSQAARGAGRDPSEIERTVAILVQLPGGGGREVGDSSRGENRPIILDRLGEKLAEYAEAGIQHVQLVLDPIEIGSISAVSGVLSM